MKLNALARMAVKGEAPAAYGGDIDVEDLIRFARIHGAAGADEIERLCAEHGWLMDGLLADGTRVVPFGRWAQVCAAFGRAGVDGLRPLLAAPESASFAVAVLEDVDTLESAQALLDFCEPSAWTSTDPQHPEWRALCALNLLLSLKGPVKATPAMTQTLSATAIRAYTAAGTPLLKTYCLYALRGAPTVQSLTWLQALSSDAPEVMQARGIAIKAIKKRLSDSP